MRRSTVDTPTSRIWYRALLSVKEVAAGEVAVICARFAEAVRAAGEPDGACLFVVNAPDADDELPPEEPVEKPLEGTAVFFSPASLPVVRPVLVRYNARPSPGPDRTHAALLVGDPADWNLLLSAIH